MIISRRTFLAGILITLVGFLVSIVLYPHLPVQMASHWNTRGIVNGTLPRFWGAFLMPILSGGLLLLFSVLPTIDPLQKNYRSFQTYYEGFILVLLLFLLYIHCISLIWNVGYHINMTAVLLPAIGLLFIFLSFLLEHATPNWFVGIRTPWTLSSATVWEKTHLLGAKLFRVLGLLFFVSAFWQQSTLPLLLPVVFLVVIGLFIYSYILFRKERYSPPQKRGKQKRGTHSK